MRIIKSEAKVTSKLAKFTILLCKSWIGVLNATLGYNLHVSCIMLVLG